MIIHHRFFKLVLLAALLEGCASTSPLKKETEPMQTQHEIAQGSNKDFFHDVMIRSSSEALWKVWTDVETWKTWDIGLKDAELNVPFRENAEGVIVDHGDRRSKFTLSKLKTNERYTMTMKLPLARLIIERSIVERQQETLRVRHRVHFDGVLGGLFASLLGKGFRAQLPKALQKLRERVEQDAA